MTRIPKLIAKVYFRALGHYPASIGEFKYKLDPYHIPYWRRVAKDEWEPETYKILSKFLKADSVYCDLGAWIGPTVLYAAKLCNKVICFEPDPVAYRYLRWNIELNQLHNITSFNVALANNFSTRTMASFGAGLGDSMTSLLMNKKEAGVEVLTLGWDDFLSISQVDSIDFLKIDIEGGEFELLPSLKEYLSKHRPIVYLSTHPLYFNEEVRREKMQIITDVMSLYKKCLNKDLVQIDINELLDESAQNHFGSYVFMD